MYNFNYLTYENNLALSCLVIDYFSKERGLTYRLEINSVKME